MPRTDAADRYSPEIAAALSAGGTWRAATMKSSGVRATRMPRAPTTMVSSVTTAIAPMDASGIGRSPRPARRIDQVGEPGLELAGLAIVEPADREQHRVEREAEHDQRERQAGHRDPGHRGGEHQAHDGEAELRVHERPDQQPAVLGVVPQVAESRHVVRYQSLIRPPYHQLAARLLR